MPIKLDRVVTTHRPPARFPDPGGVDTSNRVDAVAFQRLSTGPWKPLNRQFVEVKQVPAAQCMDHPPPAQFHLEVRNLRCRLGDGLATSREKFHCQRLGVENRVAGRMTLNHVKENNSSREASFPVEVPHGFIHWQVVVTSEV